MVHEIRTSGGAENRENELAATFDGDVFAPLAVLEVVNLLQAKYPNQQWVLVGGDDSRLVDATTSTGRDGSEVDHNERRPTTKDVAGQPKFTIGRYHDTPAILYRGVIVQFLDVDRIAELCDNIDKSLS